MEVEFYIDEAITNLVEAKMAAHTRDLPMTMEKLKEVGYRMDDAWRMIGWWQADDTRHERELAEREDRGEVPKGTT